MIFQGMEDSVRKTVVRNVAEETHFSVQELDMVYRLFKVCRLDLILLLVYFLTAAQLDVLINSFFCSGLAYGLNKLFFAFSLQPIHDILSKIFRLSPCVIYIYISISIYLYI